MDYKGDSIDPIVNLPYLPQLRNNDKLVISIGDDYDKQELTDTILACLKEPNEEKFRKIYGLFQEGLKKYLTNELSVALIQCLFPYFQSEPEPNIYSIFVLGECLSISLDLIEFEIFDSFFQKTIIDNPSSIQLISNSLDILFNIIPYFTPDQMNILISKMPSIFQMITIHESFPRVKYLKCLKQMFLKIDSENILTIFGQYFHIIIYFWTQWELLYESFSIINLAIEKDHRIYDFLLSDKTTDNTKNDFIELLILRLTKLYPIISLEIVAFFTGLLNYVENLPFQCESYLLFIIKIIELLPTDNADDKLEISIINCITRSLQKGLDSNWLHSTCLSSKHFCDLVNDYDNMQFTKKYSTLFFIGSTLRTAPYPYIQFFFFSDDIDQFSLIEIVLQNIEQSNVEVVIECLTIIKIFFEINECICGKTAEFDENDCMIFHRLFAFIMNSLDLNLDEFNKLESEEIMSLALSLDSIMKQYEQNES